MKVSEFFCGKSASKCLIRKVIIAPRICFQINHSKENLLNYLFYPGILHRGSLIHECSCIIEFIIQIEESDFSLFRN